MKKLMKRVAAAVAMTALALGVSVSAAETASAKPAAKISTDTSWS